MNLAQMNSISERLAFLLSQLPQPFTGKGDGGGCRRIAFHLSKPIPTTSSVPSIILPTRETLTNYPPNNWLQICLAIFRAVGAEDQKDGHQRPPATTPEATGKRYSSDFLGDFFSSR